MNLIVCVVGKFVCCREHRPRVEFVGSSGYQVWVKGDDCGALGLLAQPLFRGLHALQHGLFAGRVAANDTLEGLVAFDVVGEALEEGVVDDFWGFGGFFAFRCAVVGEVDAELEVHCHWVRGCIAC